MQKLINIITIIIFICVMVYFLKDVFKGLNGLIGIIDIITKKIDFFCRTRRSKCAKGLIKLIDFPYTHYPGGTEYNKLFNDYYIKLLESKKTHVFPIIVRCDNALLWYLKSINTFYDGDEIIKKNKRSRYNSGKKILDLRFNKSFFKIRRSFSINLKQFTGKTYKKASIMHFSGIFDPLEAGKINESIIFEIPASNPWEALAYIPFITKENGPSIEEILKIGKYWYKEYGAIPSFIGYNSLEVFLKEPVSKDKSLEAAKEVFAVMPDLVNRYTNTKTLSELRRSLELSPVWLFYFDENYINEYLNAVLVKEIWRRRNKEKN